MRRTMAFTWDLASRLFLGLGALLVLVAGVFLVRSPQNAIYPLGLGAAFLLAAVAMAYDQRDERPPSGKA